MEREIVSEWNEIDLMLEKKESAGVNWREVESEGGIVDGNASEIGTKASDNVFIPTTNVTTATVIVPSSSNKDDTDSEKSHIREPLSLVQTVTSTAQMSEDSDRMRHTTAVIIGKNNADQINVASDVNVGNGNTTTLDDSDIEEGEIREETEIRQTFINGDNSNGNKSANKHKDLRNYSWDDREKCKYGNNFAKSTRYEERTNKRWEREREKVYVRGHGRGRDRESDRQRGRGERDTSGRRGNQRNERKRKRSL
jgi:hypothetical protein